MNSRRSWRIEVDPKARHWLRSIPTDLQNRVFGRLQVQLDAHDDPRKFGKPLSGRWTGLWSCRVGEYRVIAELVDERLIVLVVRVGHRRDVDER